LPKPQFSFPANSKSDIDLFMEPKPSLPSVTAAGIVAILFGAFGVLMGILVELSLVVSSRFSSAERGAPLTAPSRTFSQVLWLFLIALAVFEILVGAGILRRRHWARITALVWAGIMAFISAITILFVLAGMDKILTNLPNAADVAPVMAVMKWVVALAYAIPLGVGIWWLILFTRPRVVASFTPVYAALQPGVALDAGGLPPATLPAPSFVPGRPSCPIPVLIIAGLDVFSGVSMLLFLFFPLPFSMPLFLFGRAFTGISPRIFLIAMGLIYAVGGIGILKLKPLAFDTLIAVKSLFLASGIVSLFSPQFFPAMLEAMSRISPPNAAFPANNFILLESFLRPMMIFSFVFAAALLAVLIAYRSRFLRAAEAAKKSTVA
jgi:hypothetical protein